MNEQKQKCLQEKYEEAQKEINRLQLLWAEKEDKIKELESELYFCRRNRHMENIVGK